MKPDGYLRKSGLNRMQKVCKSQMIVSERGTGAPWHISEGQYISFEWISQSEKAMLDQEGSISK